MTREDALRRAQAQLRAELDALDFGPDSQREIERIVRDMRAIHREIYGRGPVEGAPVYVEPEDLLGSVVSIDRDPHQPGVWGDGCFP